MPDHGRDVSFGYFLPNVDDPLLRHRRAGRTTRPGLHQGARPSLPALLRRHVVAARHDRRAITLRVSVFPDVANLPLRSPALNAKAAATIDRLSGGRFELGLGARSGTRSKPWAAPIGVRESR